MILHADFSRRAAVPAQAQAHHGVRSPQPGALRLPPGDITRLAAGPLGSTVDVKTWHWAALCA